VSLPADAASRVIVLGGRIDIDFVAYQDASGTHLTALNGYVLPSEAAINAVDMSASAVAARVTAAARQSAKDALIQDAPLDKLIKAVLFAIEDETNLHATRFNTLLTAIDNATTLANLKTAVLAINDLPIRTRTQIKTAVENKLDAGLADDGISD
jgi:hypothetical protein